MKYKVRINNPIIGVPITFLDKWNQEQFELIDDLSPVLNEKNYTCVG